MKLVDKYAPRTLEKVFGQDEIIIVMKDMLQRDFKDIPNFLFFGEPGTGKSSTAKAFARDLFGKEWRSHFKETNASDDRGINVVRNDIKRYCKIAGNRILFLDEFDAMTKDAQHALRVIMEKHSNVVFILSCNEPNKIIDAIKSRCANFHFKKHDNKKIMEFIVSVIKREKIKITKENKDDVKRAVKLLARKSRGDLRYALNTLEKIVTANKEINVQSIISEEVTNISEAILDKAIEGDCDEAKNLLHDYISQTGHDWERIVNEFRECLDLMENKFISMRLYIELAEYEDRLRRGSSPVIQLTGFVAMAWGLNQTYPQPNMTYEDGE